MIRFEEKAELRQRLLDAATKTSQTAWMLVEWIRTDGRDITVITTMTKGG